MMGSTARLASCLFASRMYLLYGSPLLNFNAPTFASSKRISKASCTATSSISLNVMDQRLDAGECAKLNDAHHLYQTIMANSKAKNNMERALDEVCPKLTTDLVVNVLPRLHHDGKLAFRFFTWADRHEYYEHEPWVYDQMLEIISVMKGRERQFQIIRDLIYYRKKNRVKTVPAEVISTILRKFAERHLTVVQKHPIVHQTIIVKTKPDIYAFNLLLDALCQCGAVEDADATFYRVKDRIKPNAATYDILFRGWCRVSNPKNGMKFLKSLIELVHALPRRSCHTAINAFCEAGMLKEATELFELMIKNSPSISSPTARTYAFMIRGLARNDKMAECNKLIEDMMNSGHIPDVSTYIYLIEGLCVAGKIDEAFEFFEKMRNNGYPSDVVSYNCFLKVLCANKRRDDALRLYRRIVEKGCNPTLQTSKMLFSMFFAMGDADGAFKLWNEMDKRGCVPDKDVYCLMIEGLFGCKENNAACFLLNDVLNKGMRLSYEKFDTFMMHLSAIGDLQAIHRLSEHMRSFKQGAMRRTSPLKGSRNDTRTRDKSKKPMAINKDSAKR